MTATKKDFYGKEVADAIKEACEEFGVPQEQLDIEVIATGSTGIFGLIRKKAHIAAFVKEKQPLVVAEPATSEKKIAAEPAPEKKVEKNTDEKAAGIKEAGNSTVTGDRKEVEKVKRTEAVEENEDTEEDDLEDVNGDEGVDELPEGVLELIKEDLTQILNLMGYASDIEISAKGSSVLCHVSDQYEEVLTGQDGKTLDSIQYLLRKIIARKVSNRLRLTVDVGNYREKRLEELKERALVLAEKVKNNGKTQVIAALSPSERRVIHMSLQDDKEIRSRSVGDGLFKKILIYKPGKGGGKGGGRRRSSPRGRNKGQNSRKKNE